MSKFKPFKKLHVDMWVTINGSDDDTKEVFLACDSSGAEYGRFNDEETAQRMVDCWNACRSLYSPEAHIKESAAYVKRLESLRKEAVERIAELEN